MNRPISPSDVVATGEPALFLAETVEELKEGANFLSRLTPQEWEVLRREGSQISIESGGSVFFQGDEHKGIWLIEEGRVRTFYAAPSGRQITLAYWTAGHFVGGPEIFGGGEHIWSADVVQSCRLLYLPSSALRKLIEIQPSFAICLIEGLVAGPYTACASPYPGDPNDPAAMANMRERGETSPMKCAHVTIDERGELQSVEVRVPTAWTRPSP